MAFFIEGIFVSFGFIVIAFSHIAIGKDGFNRKEKLHEREKQDYL